MSDSVISNTNYDLPSSGRIISQRSHRRFSSIEDNLVQRINHLRLRAPVFSDVLKQFIEANLDKEKQTLSFPDINKKIAISDENFSEVFLNYTSRVLQNTQFLTDYSFNHKHNTRFWRLLNKDSAQRPSLLPNTPEGIDHLSRAFPSIQYYAYKLTNITKPNMDEIIFLIIIEEFLLLLNLAATNSDLVIETVGDNVLQENIVFLSNSFSSIFSTFFQEGEGGKFTVCIVLTTEIIDGVDFGNSTSAHFKGESRQFNSAGSMKLRSTLTKSLPKYQNLPHREPPIPYSSIAKLVQEMDSNLDDRVTLNDIKRFCAKHFIDLPDEVRHAIFKHL
jgi:hypothetical protein